MKTEHPTLDEYITSNPLLLAIITEAVHRYYHDIATNIRFTGDREYIFSLHSKLWNLNPSWRVTLKQELPGYLKRVQRYLQGFPDNGLEETTSVLVEGKPDENVTLSSILSI